MFSPATKPTALSTIKELLSITLIGNPSDKINVITLNSARWLSKRGELQNNIYDLPTTGAHGIQYPKMVPTLSGYYQYGKDSSGKK